MASTTKKSVHQDVAALSQKAMAAAREDHPLRLAANDLVAYEYVDPRGGWQWCLGTVATVSGPRTVRLYIWQAGTGAGGASPPPEPAQPQSDHRGELLSAQQAREDAVEAAEAVRRDLAARQLAFRSGRSKHEEQLEVAEQTLREALAEVHDISEKDWREIRSYVKPPAIVELILGAVMVVLGERAKVWTDVLKVLREKTFVKRIEEFNPSSITAPNRRKLQDFFKNPRFTYQDAMTGSRALGALQRWVSAQRQLGAVSGEVRDYDLENKKEKDAIQLLEERLAKMDREARALQDEEDRLRALAGAAAAGGAGGRGGAQGQELVIDHGGAGRAEHIGGFDAPYTFTDATTTVLRAAVLANLGAPAATTVELTPTQVAQIADAFKARAAPLAQEQRAEAERKQLQKALDNLRQDYADALQQLEDAQNAQADKEDGQPPTSAAEDAERMRDLEDEIEDLKDQLAAVQMERDMDLEEQKRDEDAIKENGVQANGHTVNAIDLDEVMVSLERESHSLSDKSGGAGNTLKELSRRLESTELLRKVMSVMD